MIENIFMKKIRNKENAKDVSTQRDASKKEGKGENVLLVFLRVFRFI